MNALDVYCCAGGATRGLQQAGFHVTGVDHKPQPRYCGDEFIRADVLALKPAFLNGFRLHLGVTAVPGAVGDEGSAQRQAASQPYPADARAARSPAAGLT